MNEAEIAEEIDAAIRSESPHDVISNVTDVILEFRVESSWNQTEAKIVAIATFFRWMLDGGFGTYLRMPGSFTSELVYEWIKSTGLSGLENAFMKAMRVFENSEFSDVEKRQRKELTNLEMEILDRLDDEFFKEKLAIYESAARFIRSNREDLRRA